LHRERTEAVFPIDCVKDVERINSGITIVRINCGTREIGSIVTTRNYIIEPLFRQQAPETFDIGIVDLPVSTGGYRKVVSRVPSSDSNVVPSPNERLIDRERGAVGVDEQSAWH
jgi:hypothetical protein